MLKTNLEHRREKTIKINNITIDFDNNLIAHQNGQIIIDKEIIKSLMLKDPSLSLNQQITNSKPKERNIEEKIEVVDDKFPIKSIEPIIPQSIPSTKVENNFDMVDEIGKEGKDDIDKIIPDGEITNEEREKIQQKQEISRSFAIKTSKELQEMALEAKFPKEEWSKLKKNELITYLVEKI